jgi:hypothetical protein
VDLVRVQETKEQPMCLEYINKLSSLGFNNQLSGAAEARKLTLLIHFPLEPITDIQLGRAHNPEGNGSKPFSATILLLFSPTWNERKLKLFHIL